MLLAPQIFSMQDILVVDIPGVITRKTHFAFWHVLIGVFLVGCCLTQRSNTLAAHCQTMPRCFYPGESKHKLCGPFRFQVMWTLHTDFKSVVANSWQQPFYASPIYVCSGWQMKAPKEELGIKKHEVINKLDLQKMVSFMLSISLTPTPVRRISSSLMMPRISLFKFLFRRKHIGDKRHTNNGCFFHSIAVQKRAATSIRELTDDSGAGISDPSLISSMVVDYYHSLFSSQGCSEELHKVIPKLVTLEHTSAKYTLTGGGSASSLWSLPR